MIFSRIPGLCKVLSYYNINSSKNWSTREYYKNRIFKIKIDYNY